MLHPIKPMEDHLQPIKSFVFLSIKVMLRVTTDHGINKILQKDTFKFDKIALLHTITSSNMVMF